jgi:hypothetical protein
MNEFLAPAAVTLCTVALLLGCTAYVSRSRYKYSVPAPAINGHPQFEIAYRIQMNTLENTLAFLPSLWLCAAYASPNVAGLLGAAWLVTRVWYAFAYAYNPRSRGRAFTLSIVAMVALAVIGGLGLLRSAF